VFTCDCSIQKCRGGLSLFPFILFLHPWHFSHSFFFFRFFSQHHFRRTFSDDRNYRSRERRSRVPTANSRQPRCTHERFANNVNGRFLARSRDSLLRRLPFLMNNTPTLRYNMRFPRARVHRVFRAPREFNCYPLPIVIVVKLYICGPRYHRRQD
jgi:hypothetical protein